MAEAAKRLAEKAAPDKLGRIPDSYRPDVVPNALRVVKGPLALKDADRSRAWRTHSNALKHEGDWLMLTGLYHMQIPVRDLDGATDWYVTNLGFKIDGPPDGRHAFLSLADGPFLMLWKTDNDVRADFTVGDETFPVLLYRTEQIHELHDRLQSLGVRITFYKDEGFGWVLKFFDPEGNMWGVIQDK